MTFIMFLLVWLVFLISALCVIVSCIKFHQEGGAGLVFAALLFLIITLVFGQLALTGSVQI
jgi:hypothetical protein